jgi:hypothetical protein
MKRGGSTAYLVLSRATTHSRWDQRSQRRNQRQGVNYRRYLSARDDDIFRPVLHLHRPVRVPHGQVSRVEVSTVECASRRVGVLEVALHDDVPAQDDLAERFAVAGDVDERFAGLCGTDDADGERGGEGVSLPSSKFGPLGGGKRSPRRLRVVASEGSISLAVPRSEWQG